MHWSQGEVLHFDQAKFHNYNQILGSVADQNYVLDKHLGQLVP